VKDNKTKIVATLGPASSSPEKIKQLIQAGVNVFRLNFSHGSHEQHKINYDNIRKIAKDLGSVIGILLDLQGPKIRVGKFENDKITLKEKQTFCLSCGSNESLGNDKGLGFWIIHSFWKAWLRKERVGPRWIYFLRQSLG